MEDFRLVQPRCVPPLEEGFRPAVLANRQFRQELQDAGRGLPLALALERADGSVSRFETQVFSDEHTRSPANLAYAERLVKFLLWQRGGWKVVVGGPRRIGDYIQHCYSPEGPRAFDYHFMGEDVYERTFRVVSCSATDAPRQHEREQSLGRHLDGYRIGFDLGASDVKVSAVVDGQAIFSREVVW